MKLLTRWLGTASTHPATRRGCSALTLLELERRDNPVRPLPLPVIYAGAETGAPPIVKAFDAETGTLNFERTVYEAAFTGGVHVATADFTGDGFPDLVVAPGQGGGPRVRVLDGKTGDPIPGPLGDFFAYAPGFHGGVNVAAADVDGDGTPDLLTAAGQGGGPRVRVFNGKTGAVIADLFAFDPDFRGGAGVAAADFDHDGKSELVVAAGPGGGPHVKVYDLAAGHLLPGPLGSFFAYEPAFRGGVNVGTDWKAGDVTGDGVPDLVVAPGPGRAPDVKVFDGATGKQVRAIQAFEPGMTAGVHVGTAFVTDDPWADIVVGSGAGSESRVRVFNGLNSKQIVGPVGSFAPFGAGNHQGVNIAASNDPPMDDCECGAPEVPYSANASFTDAFSGPLYNYNQANVVQTVTAVDESTYHWTFEITHTSVPDPDGLSNLYDQGLARFSLSVPSVDGLTIQASGGWAGSVISADGSGSGTVAWQGSALAVGQKVTLSFNTPPRVLCPSGASAFDAAGEETSYATGTLMAPQKPKPAVMVDLGYDTSGQLLTKLGKTDREKLMQVIAEQSLGAALVGNTGANGYVASPAQPGQLVIPNTIAPAQRTLIQNNAAGNSKPDLIGDVNVSPTLVADKMVMAEVKAANENVTIATSNYQAVKYIATLRELAILFAAKPGAAAALGGKTMPGFLVYITLSDKSGSPAPTAVTINDDILKLAGANNVYVYHAFAEWDQTACKVRVKKAVDKMNAQLGPQNTAAFRPDYPPFSDAGKWVTAATLKTLL